MNILARHGDTMTNAPSNTASPSSGSERPLGVWVMVIGNILFAVLASGAPLGVILYPYEAWGIASRILAPIFILVAAGVCVSSIGVWLGSTRARAALLSLLALLTAVFVWNNIALLLDWSQMHNSLSVVTTQAWWNATIGIRALLWFAVNYWYFLGPRVRDFFALKPR